MKPAEFVAKWAKIQQKETSSYASHFDDLCRLVGHATPLEHDPTGEHFSFQKATARSDGRKGFADVFFRGHFIWEYKGPHADLDKAWRQLQRYRESLDNPPLLITSDIRTIHIHTNFTNRPMVETVVTLDDIAKGQGVEVLRRVFFDPDSFKPEKTRENITKATADTFLKVAESLRQHQQLTGEAYTPEQRAHFLIRLLFCLFAEDLGLLPDGLFTQLVKAHGKTYGDLRAPLKGLFAAMRGGGHFGMWAIRWFNGTLFDDEFVPTLPADLAGKVQKAAEQDWSAVDPSIFGTLFERIIDEDKRAQLGAHYTSKDDILLIVEPVLMEPLRRKWDEIRRITNDELRMTNDELRMTNDELRLTNDELGITNPLRFSSPHHLISSAPLLPSAALPRSPYDKLVEFSNELASIRVLDPACGSGNFLYVALRRLLDLQKEVIAYAARQELPEIPLTVGPQQLYGIEINEYAHELAQVTAWIGYLQWRHENGFAEMSEPILRPLDNIKRMDAILAYDDDGNPLEPEWPAAEVIVGNPPFLGAKWMKRELGSAYKDDLRRLYKTKVPGTADLVMYWFERTREQIKNHKTIRAGLLATNTVRQGGSVEVLRQIKESGDIFLAYTDKPWALDGASLRVSLIGFDDGTEQRKLLNGAVIKQISSDLTSESSLEDATPLTENVGISFRGHERGGPFLIGKHTAEKFLLTEANTQIIFPWFSGLDLTSRERHDWIIDFGTRSLPEAQIYPEILDYLEQEWGKEREETSKNGRAPAKERTKWWLHRRPASDLREAITNLDRFIVTPLVSKHRVFVWLPNKVRPDTRLVAIARSDDYFFGVLHSYPHELWALKLGAQHGGERPTYNNTMCFETFPFPWPPGEESGGAEDQGSRGETETGRLETGGLERDVLVADIARWARALAAWRDEWLNPPPPGERETRDAYNRLIKARTLTNLYNGLVYFREHKGPAFDRAAFDKETRKSVSRAQIEELDDIHRALDAAVFRAYGWPDDLGDEAILERLLALNLARARGS